MTAMTRPPGEGRARAVETLWQGPSLAEWLARFEHNAAASPDGTVRVERRGRAEADRSAVAFPFVQRGTGR